MPGLEVHDPGLSGRTSRLPYAAAKDVFPYAGSERETKNRSRGVTNRRVVYI